MHTMIQIWIVILLVLGVAEIGKYSSCYYRTLFELVSKLCIGLLIGSITGIVIGWIIFG